MLIGLLVLISVALTLLVAVAVFESFGEDDCDSA
jgi:hypothetical protein